MKQESTEIICFPFSFNINKIIIVKLSSKIEIRSRKTIEKYCMESINYHIIHYYISKKVIENIIKKSCISTIPKKNGVTASFFFKEMYLSLSFITTFYHMQTNIFSKNVNTMSNKMKIMEIRLSYPRK